MSPTFIVYAVIAAILMSIGGYTAYRFEEAKILTAETDRDNWKKSSEVYQEVAQELQEEKHAAEIISAKRAAGQAGAVQRANDFEQKLNAAGQADKPTLAYTDTPVPNSIRVLRRLINGCPGDLSVQCPAGAIATDPGTRDEGRDKPGPPTGSGRPAERATLMQR